MLPFENAKDVKEEVKRITNILRRDEGYIVAPANAVQPGTHIENVLTIFKNSLCV